MSDFLPEPPFRHDGPPKTGVLLVNLGTPTAPTAKALRPYLKQFLSDRRVVEIPRAIWWPILHGLILPFRPKASAAKYASIWHKDGSPLAVYTRRQAVLLKGWLGEQGRHDLVVDWAMRYGEPSIDKTLRDMRTRGIERLLVVPLYPQFSAATTATVYDDVFRTLMTLRNPPELRLIKRYHDDPAYIAALAAQVRGHWRQHGRPDKLVLSFHGMPRRSLDLGDPYHCECLKTARLLAEALELDQAQWEVAFQSRFGKAEWLKPYAAETFVRLGREKTGRLDVFCPGFVSDCVETLEEMALEGKQLFLGAGGGEFRFIPCLNDAPDWIAALGELVQRHLQGWPEPAADGADRLARAKAAGARA